MDFLINSFLDDFLRKGGARKVLQGISGIVWNKVGFARTRKGLKMYETTITQDIMIYLTYMSELTNFQVKLYEAKSEKTNGNDLECFVEYNGKYILFPMQAKIIYPNFKYSQIKHKVKSIDQVDLLIAYAKKKRGFPMYLFYNYVEDGKLMEEIEKSRDTPKEVFGISYLSAEYIKNKYQNKRINRKGVLDWIIPSFKDLHPSFAKPFYEIIDANSKYNNNLTSIKKIIASGGQGKYKFYTEDDLRNDLNWVDITPEPGIGRIDKDKEHYKDEDILEGERPVVFNPKFRVVISAKGILRQLGRLG